MKERLSLIPTLLALLVTFLAPGSIHAQTNQAPTILAQPQSLSVSNGANVSFRAIYSGTPPTVSDWYFNGQYMTGVTNSSALGVTNVLALNDVSSNNAGSYQLVITNAWGSVTSSAASLVITNLPSTPPPSTNLPVITTQPSSISTTNGASFTFVLTFTGAPTMVSEWLFNGQVIAVSTNNGLSSAVDSLYRGGVSSNEVGSYQAIIFNAYGSVTSVVATLTITNAGVATNTPPPVTNYPPSILAQPQSVYITNGANVSFRAIYTGTPTTVADWYFNGQYVGGATNSSALGLTNVLALNNVSSNNVGSYQLVITNAWGSVTSSIVTLSITNLSGGSGGGSGSGEIVPSTQPLISITRSANGSILLNLYTAPGSSSRVLTAGSSDPAALWLPLVTNSPGTNGLWQFTDTNASQYPARFYRVVTP